MKQGKLPEPGNEQAHQRSAYDDSNRCQADCRGDHGPYICEPRVKSRSEQDQRKSCDTDQLSGPGEIEIDTAWAIGARQHSYRNEQQERGYTKAHRGLARSNADDEKTCRYQKYSLDGWHVNPSNSSVPGGYDTSARGVYGKLL